jgi:hypothetical protein
MIGSTNKKINTVYRQTFNPEFVYRVSNVPNNCNIIIYSNVFLQENCNRFKRLTCFNMQFKANRFIKCHILF